MNRARGRFLPTALECTTVDRASLTVDRASPTVDRKNRQ